MTSLLIAFIATILMLCGATLGIYLNRRLPGDHLSEETKDIVKLSTGIIATIAGLVLSLLIATAKNSYDAVSQDVKTAAADFIMLDRTLGQMGAIANKPRVLLRQTLAIAIKTDLSEVTNTARPGDNLERAAQVQEETDRLIRNLTPSPADEVLRQRALALTGDLAKARWMLQQEEADVLPPAFLAVVILWLAIIFAGFGLFTPANPTAIGALVVGAISISASLFLINELNTPFHGLVRISSDPLISAFKIIGPVP